MHKGFICIVLICFTGEQLHASIKQNQLILYFPDLLTAASKDEYRLSIDVQLQQIINEIKDAKKNVRVNNWLSRAREWYSSFWYPVEITSSLLDPDLGIYTVRLPSDAKEEGMDKQIAQKFKEKNMQCLVEDDCSVLLTDAAHPSLAFDMSYMKPYWHYDYLPMAHLHGSSYLPYQFSLNELAPKQAKGITVALIDTGVAAFDVATDNRFYKHNNLASSYNKIGIDNLNVTSGKINPLKSLIEYLKPYCASDASRAIESTMLAWIEHYKVTADIKPIQQFLTENGIADISNKKELIGQGTQILTTFLKMLNSFSIGMLNAPYHHYAVLNFLPAPYRKSYQMNSLATHGSHIYGILSAAAGSNKPAGLVPHANVIMIKAFDESGVSSKSILIAALKKAQELGADIVNLSLKIADQLDMTHDSTSLLERMMCTIPYVVAASGNEGDPSGKGFRGACESYPARFGCVAFDVGAFGINKDGAFIPAFSQYEKDHGPLFVAPGVNIYSTDFKPLNYDKSSYLPRHGTSMAAALVSSYVALILGEFKDRFCKEELLKICYRSAAKLNANADWQDKTVLGAFDVHTALFVLHCIADLKNEHLSLTFDQMAAAVFYLIEHPQTTVCKMPTVAQTVEQIKESIMNKELIGVQDAIQNGHLCFAQLPDRVQKLMRD